MNNIVIDDNDDAIKFYSKSVVMHVFRNTLEDIHVEGKITDAEMKELCISMVNKMAFIFILLFNDRHEDLRILLGYPSLLASRWYDPDTKDEEEYLVKLKELLNKED